jgi:ELWxxDGT repeat protein
MLADINPGAPGSFPSDFAATTDYLYFQADNGTCGRELFRLKFSTGVVELVTDIEPGVGNSEPRAMKAYGQYIFFHAATTAHGRDLYSLNESSNTLNHLNINTAGGDIPERGGFTGFMPLYGRVYFNGFDQIHGIELYRSDGTIANTELISDIYAGPNGSQPRLLTVFNNKLYFRAHDGTHGREWWVFDPAQPFIKGTAELGETIELALVGCDPNPFDGTATITYSIPSTQPARIDVVDLTGVVIATLVDAEHSAGMHHVTLDGQLLASGTFFCRLVAGSEQRTMKVLHMK